MRFYGMSDQALFEMPARRFWLLHRSIDRIAAEETVRSAQVAAAAQNGESFTQFVADLRTQMGDVVKIDRAAKAMTAELDRQGLATLKALKPVGSSVSMEV